MLPGGYKLEEGDLKGIDAGKGAVGMKLVSTIEDPMVRAAVEFIPHGPKRSKIRLFTEDGWLMTWPSVKSGIQQGHLSIWDLVFGNSRDLPQNESQVDQLRQRYGAIV